MRVLSAEFLGTGFLLATVVGSGIMGDALSQGNDGIALLANSLATGAMLVVLITVFAPYSGAHFNPAVTLVSLKRKEISVFQACGYIISQIAGAFAGVIAAHAMFDLPLLQVSDKLRDGNGQLIAEAVATFGLVFIILGTIRARKEFVPVAVGLYITGAYWFTASTSFANPAVTIARMATDTFAGISLGNAPFFIAAQIIGALLAVLIHDWLSCECANRTQQQPQGKENL